MNEITYRRNTGYAMAVFFIACVLPIIVSFVMPYCFNIAEIGTENYMRIRAVVSMLFLAMQFLSIGYIVVRPGLSPSVFARLAAVAVLLVLIWNFVYNIYTLINGFSMFPIEASGPIFNRWYMVIIEVALFAVMTVFLFSQRFWMVTKLLGAFNYFISIISGLGYVYTVTQVFKCVGWEEQSVYWNSYGVLSGIISVVSLILCFILAVIFIIWANKRP